MKGTTQGSQGPGATAPPAPGPLARRLGAGARPEEGGLLARRGAAPLAALVGAVLFLVVTASPAAACEQVGPGLVAMNCEPEPQPDPQPQPEPESGSAAVVDIPAAAARLLELANQARAEAGVGPLSARGDVAAIAAAHSRAMAERGDIWHNDAYFASASRDGLDASRLGENVAMNGDVDDAHRRLMASPPHRANLLDGRFTVVGIAVAQAPGGTYYVTQDFLTPMPPVAAAPPASAAPTPVPAPPVAAASEAPPVPAAVARPAGPGRTHDPAGARPASRDGGGLPAPDPRAVAIVSLVGVSGLLGGTLRARRAPALVAAR